MSQIELATLWQLVINIIFRKNVQHDKNLFLVQKNILRGCLEDSEKILLPPRPHHLRHDKVISKSLKQERKFY